MLLAPRCTASLRTAIQGALNLLRKNNAQAMFLACSIVVKVQVFLSLGLRETPVLFSVVVRYNSTI